MALMEMRAVNTVEIGIDLDLQEVIQEAATLEVPYLEGEVEVEIQH